jgi:hypothetical protein
MNQLDDLDDLIASLDACTPLLLFFSFEGLSSKSCFGQSHLDLAVVRFSEPFFGF